MLEVCAKYNITSDIELITPDKINEAMERLAKNDVRYRFVIDIANAVTSNNNWTSLQFDSNFVYSLLVSISTV